jgi:tetratricopeptide (TPR) repeat protein
LVIPVTGWLVVSGLRPIRDRLREPDIVFLLAQVACFLIPFLLLDRKLGAARDWDLLAPQVAGFAWLAGRLYLEESKQPEGETALPGLRVAAPWVALIFVVPWLAVNASTERSLNRFDEIRTDFPRFPRAYAAEELGKYYRDRGDIEKSLGYYEECVATFPHNARTRILLGTNYLFLKRTDEAIEQYDKALEIDPGNWMALDMKAKVALQQEEFAAALEVYRELAPKRLQDPDIWAGYGFAAYQAAKYDEAFRAFARSGRLRADPMVYYNAGLSAGHLERWDQAILWFDRAVRAGGTDVKILYAFAVAHSSRYQTRVRAGEQPDATDLEIAKRLIDQAIAKAPGSAEMIEFRDDLEELLRESASSPPGGR